MNKTKRQFFIPGFVETIEEKVKHSIKLLQDNEPQEGYYGAFSGGKDSVVIKHLTEAAGIQATWHYHVTTIDPPELVKFIKKVHPDVIFDRREKRGMFSFAVKKGMPTRMSRWCCDAYKESKPEPGQKLILGVRASESKRRAKDWSEVSTHQKSKADSILPIFKWSDEDVWDYIKKYNVPYSELYDEGFKRLGCIGCPMATTEKRTVEFKRWPKYKAAWRKTAQRVWDEKAGTLQKDGREWWGSAKFKDVDDFFEWWLGNIPWPSENKSPNTSLFDNISET